MMTFSVQKPQLLSVQEVAAITGLGVSTIWRRSGDGSFPQWIKYGPRTTRWLTSEVEEWISAGVLTRQMAA